MQEFPFMPKATAVWLVENTTLTFKQIAEFCNLHELEIKGIADGDVAKGIKAYNPILAGQLSREEIETCSKNPEKRIELLKKVDEVLIAIPSASRSSLRALLKEIENYSIKVRILPGLSELAQGKVLVKADDDLEKLVSKIHKVEHDLLPKVINELCMNNIYLNCETNKVMYSDNLDSNMSVTYFND